jgi:hypothetical protein
MRVLPGEDMNILVMIARVVGRLSNSCMRKNKNEKV